MSVVNNRGDLGAVEHRHLSRGQGGQVGGFPVRPPGLWSGPGLWSTGPRLGRCSAAICGPYQGIYGGGGQGRIRAVDIAEMSVVSMAAACAVFRTRLGAGSRRPRGSVLSSAAAWAVVSA